MNPPYSKSCIDAAAQQFESAGLTPAEALLASVKLLHHSIAAFRDDAARFRGEIGEDAAQAFARQELNDLIYELQDLIPTAIKTYNSLLRAPGQKHDAVPGE